MFEDATFDSRSILQSRTPRWMLLTFVLNLTIVAVMIVLPLVYPESLPTQLLQRALYVPAPPVPVAIQPAHTEATPTATSVAFDPFQAPLKPPTLISNAPIGPPPVTGSIDLGGGIVGDGNPLGVIGARGDPFQSVPPVVVHSVPATKATVSGGVIEGLLVSKTPPAYPAIARAAGVSGTVVLAATISKEGTIENLRVLSGNAMLTRAAMEAVKAWRYKPYLLNKQAVEVETTINVVFSMGNR